MSAPPKFCSSPRPSRGRRFLEPRAPQRPCQPWPALILLCAPRDHHTRATTTHGRGYARGPRTEITHIRVRGVQQVKTNSHLPPSEHELAPWRHCSAWRHTIAPGLGHCRRRPSQSPPDSGSARPSQARPGCLRPPLEWAWQDGGGERGGQAAPAAGRFYHLRVALPP